MSILLKTELKVIPHQTISGMPYQHLRITIPDGKVLIPNDILGLSIRSLTLGSQPIDFSQGIVIEGRAPIWLYAYLTHECHPAAWIACYDPRLGAIVVATHNPEVTVGQVLKLNLPNVN